MNTINKKCRFLFENFFEKFSLEKALTVPNKTRTSEVGAISKAQKAQNIFLKCQKI